MCIYSVINTHCGSALHKKEGILKSLLLKKHSPQGFYFNSKICCIVEHLSKQQTALSSATP